MFFKLSKLKQMFKAAHKGPGLTVGHMAESETGIPEGYYVSSGYWIMWFRADKMPKEAKAAVIELCGDLPVVGEVFKSRKDGGNQYEIEQKELYNLPEGFMQCGCVFRVTKLLGQQDGRLVRFLQQDGRAMRVTAVPEKFMEAIDTDTMDRADGESEPAGPVTNHPEAKYMYWGNDRCYFMVCTREPGTDEEKEFWNFLRGTEIP